MRIRVSFPRSGSLGGIVGRNGWFRLGSFRFPATSSDGDVTEDAAFSPVASAALAEVSRLGEIIVVIVAKFGVQGIATRTLQSLLVILVVVWP